MKRTPTTPLDQEIRGTLQLVPATTNAPSAASHTDPTTATPLDREIRVNLPTDEAAHHINRRPQTLRRWACLGDGPIRPVRINGRLAWPVAELRRLLGVAA